MTKISFLRSGECNKCGECCKYMGFPIMGKIDELQTEFLRTRGVKSFYNEEFNATIVLIPHRCLHLTNKGKCKIHHRKPEICKIQPNHPMSHYGLKCAFKFKKVEVEENGN